MNLGIPIRVILRFGLDETVVAMFFILGTKITSVPLKRDDY